MKKHLFALIGVSLLAVTTLGSCNTNPNDGGSHGGDEGPSNEVMYDGYFKLDQNKYKTRFNDLREAYAHKAETEQVGNVRAFVVPIEFTDYTADLLPAGREGTKMHIEKALFGGDSEHEPLQSWESLSSFYEKSSYGQMHITGEVMDWYQTGDTIEQYELDSDASSLMKKIHRDYSYGNAKKGIEKRDLNEFDGDGDGYIDLFLMVYAATTGSKSDVGDDHKFWAYTSDYTGPKIMIDNQPKLCRYWWTSYEFMYKDGWWEDEEKGIGHHEWTNEEILNNHDDILDSHTFIHETGHGFGLDDYYSYDNNHEKAPMGGVDMMDANVGDHNAYSKAIYGWISPYVVQDSCEIRIKPFQQNGDSILVPALKKDWRTNRYTLLDEYLMIQYDTPEGLAYKDGLNHYEGQEFYPEFYNEPGVQIMHADSRIAMMKRGAEGGFQNYTTSLYAYDETNYYTYIAHSNTPTRSQKDANGKQIYLLQMVEPAEASLAAPMGYRSHESGNCSNNSLWRPGQTMTNFQFHESVTPGSKEQYKSDFSISFKDMDETGVTVVFTAVK